MHSSLYVKFLGKALPLDEAKQALADTWRGLGSLTVSDLPNGFYYILCELPDMQDCLLWDEPLIVPGRIHQLSAWGESFQPAFEKLSSEVV